MNSNVEIFDFQFGDVILRQLDILDSVLSDLGRLSLFENSDFTINKESAGTFFLRISLNIESSNIPIDILLEGDGMRLDIFHLPESFEWSKRRIEQERGDIELFFKNLLTSYVLIEGYGLLRNKSCMYLFDKKGKMIEKHILSGIIHTFSSWEQYKSLFFPIY